VFKIYADGARVLVGSGPGQEIIPRAAVSDALVNRIVEDGNLPGLEAAIEMYGKVAERGEGNNVNGGEPEENGAALSEASADTNDKPKD
jgi:hypothetical protein